MRAIYTRRFRFQDRAMVLSVGLCLAAGAIGNAQTVTNNTTPLTLGTGGPMNLLVVPVVSWTPVGH